MKTRTLLAVAVLSAALWAQQPATWIPSDGNWQHCGGSMLVIDGKNYCVLLPPSEPIDVPASERKRDDPAIDYGVDCVGASVIDSRGNRFSGCDLAYQAQRWHCKDGRYLLGPNDKGEYICHKAQTGGAK